MISVCLTRGKQPDPETLIQRKSIVGTANVHLLELMLRPWRRRRSKTLCTCSRWRTRSGPEIRTSSTYTKQYGRPWKIGSINLWKVHPLFWRQKSILNHSDRPKGIITAVLGKMSDDSCRFHSCKLLSCWFQLFCIKLAGLGKHWWAGQGRNSMADWMLWI